MEPFYLLYEPLTKQAPTGCYLDPAKSAVLYSAALDVLPPAWRNHMLSVQEALSSILLAAKPLPSVNRPLAESLGSVLAEDVFADVDNPPFDTSGVDGFAVRAIETSGASKVSPVILRCIEEVAAGTAPSRSVTSGECAKVMTGAPIPFGVDAMVMREDASECGDLVEIRAAAQASDHIRSAGEDFRSGDKVLSAGSIISSAEIAMLAAVGRSYVNVVRRPRVAVFSTGDELVDLDVRPGFGKIRDSNRYTLEALVREAGADVCLSRQLPDDQSATEEALARAAGNTGEGHADIIVTSGGVSVGDHDYVKPTLEKLGRMELWRVKMKPGKPLAFGSIGKTLFVGLPGNPVSTMVTFELFVRPLLWKLAGRTHLDRLRLQVEIAQPIFHAPGRTEYVRSVVWLQDESFVARATGAQGSGILTSMLGANALVVVPEDSPGLNSGGRAEAILLAPPLLGSPE